MAEEIAGAVPVDALAEAGLFGGLNAEQLGVVAGAFRVWRYAAGEPVFRKGDVGQDVYVILKGLVTIRDPGPIRGAGREVAVLRAGQIFGEIAFIDSGTRSMDAICATASDLGVLSQETFYALVADQPLLGAAILHNLATILCQRLRRADEELYMMANAVPEEKGGALSQRLYRGTGT